MMVNFFTIFIFIFFCSPVFSVEYKVVEKSKVDIEGSSTLHDWNSQVTEINGRAEIVFDGEKIKNILNVDMNIPVKSIKSDKEQMDDLTYKALKRELNPHIKLKCPSLALKNSQYVEGTCSLEIAGRKNKIEFIALVNPIKESLIQFAGTQKISMLNYGITRPSVFMGMIEADDEVKVGFSVFMQSIDHLENKQQKSIK